MANYRQPSTPYTGSPSPKTLTSERIAADIAAFNRAGGHIEVLGNTPFHKPQEAKAPADAKSASKDADAPSGKK